MKVLHVIPSVSIVRGGPSHAVIDMVKALNDNNVTTEIITTNDDGPSQLDVPLNQKINYKNVPLYFFKRYSPDIAAIREFTFSWPLTRWLWQHINEYDLIQVHAIFSYPSTIAMLIARIKKVPYICRPLGQLCIWSLQQKQRKKQLYLKLIEKKNLESSKALHLTSGMEQNELASLNLNINTFILPHGLTMPPAIDNPKQQLYESYALDPETPILLFMSRIHPKKGIELLIKSLSRLKTPFTLIIAGAGEKAYEEDLKQRIIQEKLQQHIHWAGFVTGHEKNRLLQGSDLFVLPSYSENFGIVVLEALASGTPVITTKDVALSDVIQQYQLGKIIDHDEEKWAQTMACLLSNQTQLTLMGQKAINVIKKQYSWNNIAKQLIIHYKKIS